MLIKISKVIFLICLVIFCGKQILRYSKNFNSKFFWPRIYSYESNKKIIPKAIKIGNNFTIYQYDGLCMYSKSPCTTYSLKENLKVTQKFSYTIINLIDDYKKN